MASGAAIRTPAAMVLLALIGQGLGLRWTIAESVFGTNDVLFWSAYSNGILDQGLIQTYLTKRGIESANRAGR